jgi:signal transduction histidine kinase
MRIKTLSEGKALATLSHECRSPLETILYALQWSRERLGDMDAQLEMCAIVERQATFLAQAIAKARALASVEAANSTNRRNGLGSAKEFAFSTDFSVSASYLAKQAPRGDRGRETQ